MFPSKTSENIKAKFFFMLPDKLQQSTKVKQRYVRVQSFDKSANHICLKIFCKFSDHFSKRKEMHICLILRFVAKKC